MPIGYRPTGPSTLRQRPADDRWEFTKGLAAGIDQTQALGGGFLALLGSATGNDTLFYEGLDYYNQQMAEASENQADVGRLEDIDGIDDFGAWLFYTAGNALPSLATTVAGGGLGGIAAKAAVKKKVASEAEKFAEKRVRDASETALRRKVADDYARNALSKAGMRGATAGAITSSTALSSGESFTRIMEEAGEERPGVALATGIAAGLLDAAAPLAALKRILPKGTYQRALNRISDDVDAKRPRVTRAITEAIKIGGVEGLTEMTQEILQTSAVQLVESENDPELRDRFFSELFNETNRSLYINAFAAGAVGGGLLGGTMGFASKGKKASEEQVSDQELFDKATSQPAQPQDDPKQKKKAAEEEKALEDIEASREDARNIARTELDSNPQPPAEAQSEEQVLEEIQADRVAAREQARAEADANPERTNERTGGLGTRRERQEVARLSIDRQLGMRLNQHLRGRQQAKQIAKQMGLDLRLPPDPKPAPVVEQEEQIPVYEPAPLAALEGQMVSYQGIEGMLVRNETGFFVENDEQSTLIESGEVATPEQLGIEVIDNTVNRERDVKFTSEDKKLSNMPATLRLDGKVYTYESTNTNDAGETVSITAVTANGERRTFRNPEVVERFERQIIESEQGDPMQALIDLETLPIEVQEAVMEQAEAQQQPMPDEIPVDEAVSIAQAIDPDMAEQVQEAASVSTVMRDRQGESYDDFRPYASITTRPGLGVPDALVTNKKRAESTLQNQAGDSMVVDVVEDQDLNNLQNSDSRIMAHRGPKGERLSRNFNELSEQQQRTLEKAIIDVVSSGVPVQLFRDLKDLRFFRKQDVNSENTNGFYDFAQNVVAIKSSNLNNRGGKDAADLRWSLTHELSHALDQYLDRPSENDPRFQLKLADRQMAINVHKVEMGEAINELYESFMQDTPLGKVLEYPFYLAVHQIRLNREQGASNDVLLRSIQREAFAQAFATYFSNPALLKDNAPTAYDFIRESIDAYRNEGETAPRESTEVSGEVSAPAPTGGIQDGDSDVRQGSEDSPVQEQASEEVGGARSEPRDVEQEDPRGRVQGKTPLLIYDVIAPPESNLSAKEIELPDRLVAGPLSPHRTSDDPSDYSIFIEGQQSPIGFINKIDDDTISTDTAGNEVSKRDKRKEFSGANRYEEAIAHLERESKVYGDFFRDTDGRRVSGNTEAMVPEGYEVSSYSMNQVGPVFISRRDPQRRSIVGQVTRNLKGHKAEISGPNGEKSTRNYKDLQDAVDWVLKGESLDRRRAVAYRQPPINLGSDHFEIKRQEMLLLPEPKSDPKRFVKIDIGRRSDNKQIGIVEFTQNEAKGFILDPDKVKEPQPIGPITGANREQKVVDLITGNVDPNKGDQPDTVRSPGPTDPSSKDRTEFAIDLYPEVDFYDFEVGQPFTAGFRGSDKIAFTEFRMFGEGIGSYEIKVTPYNVMLNAHDYRASKPLGAEFTGPGNLQKAVDVAKEYADAYELEEKDAVAEKYKQEDRIGLRRTDDAGEPVLDIPFSVLSPEAQQITASTVLYGDESIPVTPEGQRITIKDLGFAFDERVRDAVGTDLDERTPENKKIISDLIAHEAVEALSREGNAGQWYQEKVAAAMELAAQAFPEIATDPNAEMAFKAIVAVTSNGASVQENAENSFAVYQDYRATGRFPNFGSGKESPSMKKGFKRLNEILDSDGPDTLREFLSTEFTVKELKQLGYTISGENVDVRVYGSAILGPKIGQGFYQNLNGNYDPLTMDRWFMRTWGRLTGTMMINRKKLPAALENFRKTANLFKSTLRKDGISIVQLRKDDDLAMEYADTLYKAFSKGSFKDKNALNNASRSVNTAMGALEAPQNGGHRKWIREVMGEALAKVNAEIDEPINMGALQAIIWYPEKDLYKQLGVGNKRSEPTDYETEFRKIVEQGQLAGQAVPRSGGPEQQSGTGAVRQQPAGVDTSQEGSDQVVSDIPETVSPELDLPELSQEKLARPSADVTTREKVTRTVESLKTDKKGFIADKWQGFVQGVFDDVNRIGYYEREMNDGKLMDGAQSAYKAALASKNVSVVAQAVMEAGPLQLKDGAFQLVEDQQGFYKIFDGYTKNELRDWELWASANRASRLIKEDRENLFTQEDIDTILNTAREKGLTEKYQGTLDKWIKFNRQMLDMAEQAGVLNPQKRKLWDKNDYVPFFRFEDESEVNDLQNDSLRIRRGLDGQVLNIKQLKGGEGKINPLESMVSQVTTMIDRSFKNEAMRRLVDNMEGYDDVITEIPSSQSNLELAKTPDNNLIKVYYNGEARVFQVKDPVLLRSIQGVGGYSLDALSQVFSIPKKALTRGVTLDPGFMIANAFRDLLATSIQFPNAPNPITSITKAMKYIGSGVAEETLGQSESESYLESKQSLYKIMASGGLALGDFYGSGESENIRNDINRINSLDTTLNTPEKLEKFHSDWLDAAGSNARTVWEKWNRIGGKFEQASRINLYEAAIKNGETHAEAVAQAADILNFSKRGDFKLIQFMVHSYPFFNARLQGLNVLARSLRDNTKHVALRGGGLAAASIALYMMNREEEKYEQLPDYDKDLNFHFFLGDEHYRLPKPFELGLMFGTLPERMATYAIEEDKDMEYLFDGVRDGVMTSLSFDFFPQIVKPLVDVYSNEDSFREQRIVSRSLEDAPPEMQFNQYTSETAKAIALGMPDIVPDEFRSPMYVEYLLKGYFGTISGYGLQVMDRTIRDPDLPVEPELLTSQLPVIKRFYRTGIETTKYGNEFFELRKAADDLNREYKALVENGRTRAAQDFLNRNGGYEEVRRGLNAYYKKIKQLNKKRDLIYKDRVMSASEKTRRLAELTSQRNKLYREAVKKYDDYL